MRLKNSAYTVEPVFAGFVNAAPADGWTLVPYEFEGGRGLPREEVVRMREEAQARNLVERIFAKDKDARVLVYVGYSHHYKKPVGSEGLTMMGERTRRWCSGTRTPTTRYCCDWTVGSTCR